MDEQLVVEEQPEKSVSSDLIRGHINTIILRSLYDGDKYGYEIIAEIERKSHGQYTLKQPSLYSALKRLEKDGYVTSYWGGSVSGGRRKYFSLTESGKAISEQNQAEWEYSRTVIDSLISDKDFDFSNPAPTAVNMRMLRETTSRVPRAEGAESELDFQPSFEDAEELGQLEARYREQLKALEERDAALRQREESFETDMQARSDAFLRENSWREREIEAREQAIAQKRAELEALRSEQTASAQQEDKRAEELLARISSLEYELRESEAALEEARRQNETLTEQDRIRAEELRETDAQAYEEKLAKALEEERARHDEETRNREAVLADERVQHAAAMREKDAQLEEERARHAEELRAQEARIIAEQEEIFRKREQQLLHRNYLDLVNAPPSEEEPHDYTYYSPAPEPQEQPPAVEDYRTVVHRLYANAVSGEAAPAAQDSAKPLDGIDFSDLEARAAQDGIRIQTAGAPALRTQVQSESFVNKGKALFLSGIVTFLFCVALGSILLGVTPGAGLPAFFPYLIWGLGLAVLLVTGLAYANRYGERALRRTGPVILNVVVGYILLVIVTLIAALTARADLNDPVLLNSWVTIPVIGYLGLVLFGVVYYLQVRPKKEN